MKATNHGIIHSRDSGNNLKKQQTTKQESAQSVLSLPQILVAMNLAFCISGSNNNETINKGGGGGGNEKPPPRSAWVGSDEEEIATDASVKHCQTSHDRGGGVALPESSHVPTVITTPLSSSSQERHPTSLAGALTLESLDSSDDLDDASRQRKTMKDGSQIVKEKIRDLRTDLRQLTPNGVAGKLLFWWVHPVKWVADPGTYVRYQRPL
jgi:hypothetical protein